MPTTIRRMSQWTVVSIHEPTGELLRAWVSAADEWDAFAKACAEFTHPLNDVTLVAALPGRHKVCAPTDDSDQVCAAIDYPTD